MPPPDFYLASSEGYDMEEPRQCWRIRRVASEKRNDWLLIKISPPLLGQKFGLGDQDIVQVLIAPRHVGGSLFPINEWPLYVHVARLLIDDPENYSEIRESDWKLIAWAEIYKTQKDALTKAS